MTDNNNKRNSTEIAYIAYYESPIGTLELVANSRSLKKVDFVDRVVTRNENSDVTNRVLKATIRQLGEYFSGDRQVFALPLVAVGTLFQQTSWNFLRTIPYAETRTYSEQATAISNTRAVRAVAQANHNNPITIIVPCHRVIGKDGALTGYGGGIWRKKWLLEHELKYQKQ